MQRKMTPSEKKQSLLTVLSALVWTIVYVVCSFILKRWEVAPVVAIALAAVPGAAFVLFLFQFMREVGAMDELRRRIQLEAIVVAFCLVVLMMMVLSLLDTAHLVSAGYLNLNILVATAAGFYLIGLFVANRRYR